MFRLTDYSISTRLTLMNMLVSGTALLLACAAFFVYDWITFRQGIVENLSIQAQIIEGNSRYFLVFNDSDSAEDTLSALSASPHISSAAIYTADGHPLAVYRRNPAGENLILPSIPSGQVQVHAFAANRVGLTRLIQSEGKPAGTVYIESDLEQLSARLVRYMGIMAVVLFVSLLAALVISFSAKRAISEPIAHLAKTAQVVSREKNYSLRANMAGLRGDLADLTESFNDMLSQIQQRDSALERGRTELEHRVEQRTAQLADANRELEAFSYSVSHDLRAPLRHIDGFSAILEERYGPALDPDAQRYLKHVREGARNMGMLVDDLLNMAQIGRKELVCKPTDMNLLVREVIVELRSDLEGRQIDWRISSLPTVDCDPGLMKVVFTNLVSNAVKYTRKTASAVIEVNQMMQDGSTLIFVRDNGAGFDQKYVHKLFGVFQRLHRAEDFEGTGVGLATVQRIIQKHGGQIWARGEVNKGATFSFVLSPASSGPAGARGGWGTNVAKHW